MLNTVSYREIQVKTMRYHHRFSTTAIIKKTDNLNVGEIVKTLEPSYHAHEEKKINSHYSGTQFGNFFKNKYTLTM